MLGGAVTFEYPGDDGALAYVGVDLGASHIGIGFEHGISDPPRPRPISLWVYADDCDGVVERIRRAGHTVTEEPADQPWRERTARVLDPDGNVVIIGQRAGPRADGSRRICGGGLTLRPISR
jgi:uncharacterized glyoxalase superfamily protein PhnB